MLNPNNAHGCLCHLPVLKLNIQIEQLVDGNFPFDLREGTAGAEINDMKILLGTDRMSDTERQVLVPKFKQDSSLRHIIENLSVPELIPEFPVERLHVTVRWVDLIWPCNRHARRCDM
jgi:hypothetical protein